MIVYTVKFELLLLHSKVDIAQRVDGYFGPVVMRLVIYPSPPHIMDMVRSSLGTRLLAAPALLNKKRDASPPRHSLIPVQTFLDGQTNDLGEDTIEYYICN